MVGPLAAKPICLGEGAVEMLDVEVAVERGELVKDHLRLRLSDHVGNVVRVERVHDGGARAHRLDGSALRLTARGARHLVPGRHEPGDELLPQRSCRARQQDLHRGLLEIGVITPLTRQGVRL
jgi:hypothetical protein